MNYETEARHCERVADGLESLEDFNYSLDCFRQYCSMQQRSAARAGASTALQARFPAAAQHAAIAGTFPQD